MDLSNVYSFVIEILELEWTGKNGLSNGILLEVHLVHFRLSLAAYRTSRFSAPLACRSYPKLLETQARQYQLCICVEHSTSFVKHLFNFQSRDNNSLSIIIKRQRPPKAKSKNAKRHLGNKNILSKTFLPSPPPLSFSFELGICTDTVQIRVAHKTTLWVRQLLTCFKTALWSAIHYFFFALIGLNFWPFCTTNNVPVKPFRIGIFCSRKSAAEVFSCLIT